MRHYVIRRPNIVFLLIAAYFLFSFLMRLVRPHALEFDDAEQALLSQFVLSGYGTQPPFYNWLQFGLTDVLGLSLASMTLLKSLLLLLTCVLFGLTGRLIIRNPTLSVMPMLGILTLPPIFLLSQRDLSHTVAALLAVALFLYGFFLTLRKPTVLSYVLTGIAVGIGLISKYNFVILPVAAILAVLPEADFRNRIFDKRVLIAVLVAIAIVMPHTIWLLQNLDRASGGTLSEMKEGGSDGGWMASAITGTLSLLAAAARGSALPLIAFGAIFYRDLSAAARSGTPWSRIVGRMLLLCLVCVFLVVVGLGATQIREKWLILFMVLLPLYLSLKLDAADVEPGERLWPLVLVSGTLTVGVVVMLTATSLLGPLIGSVSNLHIPYARFADEVVAQKGMPPATILVTDRLLGGNLHMQFPTVPILTHDFPGDEKLAAAVAPGAVLLVWMGKEGEPRPAMPPLLEDFGKQVGVAETFIVPQYLTLPYKGSNEEHVISFGYAWGTVSPP